MKAKKLYNDREWEEIASSLTGENDIESGIAREFREGDSKHAAEYFINMKSERGKMNIDVDSAWKRLYKRLNDDGLLEESNKRGRIISPGLLLRIAASVIIVIGLAFSARYIATGYFVSPKSSVVATIDDKNRLVEFEDGSRVYLNRHSELTFPNEFSKRKREVELKGEAYFEIQPDPSRPFIIDAGSGSVEVLGTSFNVKSGNKDNDVEVLVTTGKVLLKNNDGSQHVILEPGFIGKVGPVSSEKNENSDKNYLAWNTEVLVYEATSLNVVFKDLEEVYGLSVETSDNEILSHRLTSTFNKNRPETIIQLICTTFNLKYELKGDKYILSK